MTERTERSNRETPGIQDRRRQFSIARLLACAAVAVLVLASGGPAAGAGGMVALQTADGSCEGHIADIYVGCGNGTVTDNRTGLIWLANASCFGKLDWSDAMDVVAGLGDMPPSACAGMDPDDCDCGLSDNSSPGEWRLPSMAELKTMTATKADADVCEPAILNDAGTNCWAEGCYDSGACSFYGVKGWWYWSSSSFVPDAASTWCVDVSDRDLDTGNKGLEMYVWPVRGGQ